MREGQPGEYGQPGQPDGRGGRGGRGGAGGIGQQGPAGENAHPSRIILLAILAGLVVAGGVGYRAYQTSRTAHDICAKVDRLDAALIKIVQSSTTRPPKPGEYGYAYYATHPVEARSLKSGAVSAQQLAILRSAACDPANIGP